MEITSDIQLRGTAWNELIEGLSEIFTKNTRPHYSLFMLGLAVGIMYDKRIEKPIENGEEIKSVPRNVINNNDNGKLDFFFQAAILSTKTESFNEEERLELAFADSTDFDKISFLVSFANYGAEQLRGLIGSTPIESMDKIKEYLEAAVEGIHPKDNELDWDELGLDVSIIDDELV